MAAGSDVRPSEPATAPVASVPAESEQILRELLHTDRLIAILRPKIARSGNTKAQEQLAESVRREKEARTAFENHLYARAVRLTRESRSLAREAAVMVGPPEEDPIYVSRTIEHAADALSLAQDALRGVSLASVKKRYAELSRDLETARQLYKNGAVRRAYEQATSVRNGVLALLSDCEGLPVSYETAERALKGAERALERAGKDLGPKPNAAALRLRKEAAAQLAKARSSFARKEYKDAVIHSKLVERNLDD
ncbi:MAG TPA: hypothetical protein VIG29_08810, partial [Vicinamibacteria bacterium]